MQSYFGSHFYSRREEKRLQKMPMIEVIKMAPTALAPQGIQNSTMEMHDLNNRGLSPKTKRLQPYQSVKK